MDDVIDIMTNEIAKPVDIHDRPAMLAIVKSCIGTKLIKQWEGMACKIALDAVLTVALENEGGHGRTSDDSSASVFVNSRTLIGCTGPLRRGD